MRPTELAVLAREDRDLAWHGFPYEGTRRLSRWSLDTCFAIGSRWPVLSIRVYLDRPYSWGLRDALIADQSSIGLMGVIGNMFSSRMPHG